MDWIPTHEKDTFVIKKTRREPFCWWQRLSRIAGPKFLSRYISYSLFLTTGGYYQY